MSLAGHVANGILVYALTIRLCDDTSLGSAQRRAAGLVAALLFLLHPSAVETVAWASAWPYVLATSALLVSFYTYLAGRADQNSRESSVVSRVGFTLSIASYAISLLARAAALGYPIVLLIVDLYPLRRHPPTSIRRLVIEKTPFIALSVAAATVEWRARDITSLQEMGLASRAGLAVTAPFVYLWRTVWPVRLSPLYPLPILQDPTTVPWLPLAAGLTGLVAVTALAWAARERWPIAAAAWAMYLSLVAPIAGLTPSGIQATADRYMYVPGVLVAIVAGVTGVAGAQLVKTGAARKAAALIAAGVIVILGTLTWRQAGYWRDSITLWARAAGLDARNDVAAYNLAVALAGAGREEDAIAWYEHTLSLVPDHDLARGNLAILQAARAERNGDRLASQGRVGEASDEYARALSLDAGRSHARAARGMLLLKSGRLHEAIGELRLALGGDVKDVEVPNALAFALAQTGETAEAAGVLERAAAQHPDDVNVKHNLARMLATATDPQVRDGARAVRLALEVCERTAFQDPRALDTLSAAYAASGRRDLARATAARAEARARELGDVDMAAAITEHARSYGR